MVQNERMILETIHDALWDVLERRSEHPEEGICNAVFQESPYTFDCNHYELNWISSWLHNHFKKWPMYSGNFMYPVPAPLDWNPEETLTISNEVDTRFKDIERCHSLAEECYHEVEDLWEGEYGENRIWLLMYLLEQVQKELGYLK
jgi:hypothetical protein